MKDAINTVFDGLSELIYVSDLETHALLYLNKAGRELYGFDAMDGAHKCYEVLQGREAPCEFCTNSLLSKDSFYEWEFTNPTRNRHYLLRDRLIDWYGRPARLEIAFDITDRRSERRALQYLVEADSVVLSCIQVLESDCDPDHALDEVLRMVGSFFEADRVHVLEIDGCLLSSTHEWCAEGVASQKKLFANLPVSLLGSWMDKFVAGEAVTINNIDSSEVRSPCDGQSFLMERGVESVVAVPLESKGKVIGIIGVDNPHHRDRLDVVKAPLLGLSHFVSSNIRRHAAQRRIAELTWSDRLTGALSRAAFHRDFDQGAFDRLGFALVDVDRLTSINREQGRDAGDKVLCRIAAEMKAVFGERVYRIGDDEFCAVLEDVDYASFTGLASEAVRRLAASNLPGSIGPAWCVRCEDAATLLDTAHARMARAKLGRHRATDMGVDLAANAAVSGLLRPGGAQEAVETGKLDIYLMPQASGCTGKLVSAEALIRYLDSEGCIQALPASFIPALEDMGEVAYVDFFALRRACETIVRWQREGREVVPLAVNFSRVTVEVEGFVDYVVGVVSGHGVDPSLIELEVTESARGQSREVQIRVANELRARGFRIAVDDFGVDNANFSLFTQLKFDVLKLDKSLVWGLAFDDRTLCAVRGLINLCADLGIESVAEGIESEDQYRAVRAAGCTRVQGYLIGRPVPIEEFERSHLA